MAKPIQQETLLFSLEASLLKETSNYEKGDPILLRPFYSYRTPYSLQPVHPVWSLPHHEHWPPFQHHADDPFTIHIKLSIQKKKKKSQAPISAKHPYKGHVIDLSI
ncbi:hypothetical protein [Ammoniphilus sp. 3BR4]|uniref:hypothetical protein n=1 Tax=Ammoniphilus sp. 3BR4 TaxID=3158265 RepID=UPI00346698BE